MKNLTLGKSFIAIFTALVFALLILCASVATHFTNAYAEEGYSPFNEEITITADSTGMFGEAHGNTESDWAVFYHGIKPLETAQWKTDDASGTVTFSDNKIIAVYDSDGERIDKFETGDLAGTPLDTECTHDFTSDAGNKYWELTDNGHWAVCSECLFELEVSHRLSPDGTCQDCGYEFTGLENTYSFTIPDSNELDNTIDGNKWEGNVLTIEITNVSADLVAGCKLNLYLSCAGIFGLETGEEITYTINVLSTEITATHKDGIETTGSLSSDDSELISIWSYQAPIPEEYDPDNLANSCLTHISGTITIILTIDEDTVIYPDTYTGTLTFSAELEYEEEY